MDTAQTEALLVHTRQDTAAVHLQTVTITKAVAQNNTFIRRIQIGIVVVIALQVAQLSGCHWG
ncbi:hypothetical protein [Methylobacterium sp. SI9]|uniref:hypothetical protein n=1 Tax=Methylobacterium guangdongense TaxID=3138811 RepID=UPI00313DAA27